MISTTQRPYIVCIDDERTVLDALMTQLRNHLGAQYRYEGAESGKEAIEIIQELMDDGEEIAVIISDQMMPEMKGVDALALINKFCPEAYKILLTGVTNAQDLARAVNEAGLYRYIAKPWEKYDLLMTVDEALKSYRQDKTLQGYTETLETLVSASQTMSKQNKLEDVCRTVNQFLIKGAQVERGGIILFDAEEVLFAEMFHICGKEYYFDQDITLYPMSLILNAARCDEPIVVSAPAASPLLSKTYLEQWNPGSIYCLPMHHNEKLTGVMYLETRQNISHFNANRIKFIELLAYEATPSVEKAKMIHGLETIVEERTQELKNKSRVIEARNKDMIDSIQYARRLQMTFLQPANRFQSISPESFIYYQPKDVISGDFYWFHDTPDFAHFAVVDCTGHGVPGAMLAIFGLNLIQQVVHEECAVHPEMILRKMNRTIDARLCGQHAQQTNLDSMDAAVCCLHKKTGLLEFSGAKRPLYFMSEGELQIIPGDLYSLGGTPLMQDPEFPFRRHTLQLHNQDRVFLFSDGVTDQFGGSRNRKFTPRRFQEFLTRNQNLEMNALRNELADEMAFWKGPHEQTDDILVMGLEFQKAAVPQFGPFVSPKTKKAVTFK